MRLYWLSYVSGIVVVATAFWTRRFCQLSVKQRRRQDVDDEEEEESNSGETSRMVALQNTVYEHLRWLVPLALVLWITNWDIIAHSNSSLWLSLSHVFFLQIVSNGVFYDVQPVHPVVDEPNQPNDDDEKRLKMAAWHRNLHRYNTGMNIFLVSLFVHVVVLCLLQRHDARTDLQQNNEWYAGYEEYDYFGKASVSQWIPTTVDTDDDASGVIATDMTLTWDCPGRSTSINTCQTTIEFALCSFHGSSRKYRGVFYATDQGYAQMDVVNVDEQACLAILTGTDDDTQVQRSRYYEDAHVNVLGSCTTCEALPLTMYMKDTLAAPRDCARQATVFAIAAFVFLAMAGWEWKRHLDTTTMTTTTEENEEQPGNYEML